MRNPKIEEVEQRIRDAIKMSNPRWKAYWEKTLALLLDGLMDYDVEMERKLEAIEKQMLYYDPDDERED
ncbi:MAG: hypothetical protein SF029_02750 [bacterium]|nr:hypothetical protein [bacterium]